MHGTNLFGQNTYAAAVQDDINPEDYYIDLMDYLPPIFNYVKQMKELQTVLGYETGKFVYASGDLLNQCFITTATWGLERWEKELGLPIDRSKPNMRRREILLAKLRGAGTTTKEMIKNVAIAFSGGEVAIIEYPVEYRFVVQFVGVKGIPQNMEGLINAIEEIKPAHLAYSFKYTYSTWNMISGLTWSEAGKITWSELKIYEGDE